ncbi:MAG: GcrA family cell cycle regulator [Caulobacteraceae bacterium]
MTDRHNHGWTDERTERAKNLYEEGYSCSQVAQMLGGVTRNGVIGKLHRMGVAQTGAGRGASKRQTAAGSRNAFSGFKGGKPLKVARPLAERAPRGGVSAPIDRPPTEVTTASGVLAWPVPETALALLDLGPEHCRFPVGEATGADQLFCAAQRPEGEAYCPACQPRAGGQRRIPANDPRALEFTRRFANWR